MNSESRATQIFNAFRKFHQENPRVWDLFQRFTMEMIQSGRSHYSSNAVFERIRWHMDIETRGSEVKLNNNFRAYYARMFHAKYPQHGEFFRNRERTSENHASYENDQQVFILGAPVGEERLMQELSTL